MIMRTHRLLASAALGLGLTSLAATASLADPVPYGSLSKSSPAASSSPRSSPARSMARTPAGSSTAARVDPDAMQALQRMSAFLSGLDSFKLQSQTSLDVVTMQGQRLELDGVTTYKVKRPNGFVITVDSDLKQRTFVYDGKTFTIVAPKLGYYATAAAPPTIRETLQRINDRFGVQLPLEDLFRWNDPSSSAAREQITSGFKVGTATIDGVETDQYAFRQGDVDWQVWIQQGDQPVPRKVVIVDRTDPANPGYTARLSWTLNPPLTAADFVFTPDPGLKPIRFTASNQ
jgi:hypothetical protein